MSKGTIILAAGGTGGHLFPAEALAHELIERGWTVELATDERAGRFAGHFPASAFHTISSSTIGSRNPLALAKSFWSIWQGVRQTSKIIAKVKPAAVVGFGGYPTLPPLYAAVRRRVPTLIHEQNAVMGRANRALAGQVSAIAGGFLTSEKGGANAAKIVVTGNPVRPAVLQAAKSPYVASIEADPFRLLVFGGSQGAQFFSDAIPPAIASLPENLRRRLKVTQQARVEDMERVRAAYAELGVDAEVEPFFNDMAHRMALSHLVISRSGASTVSEVAVIGRPAILVPYPHALDHDQAANAAALAQAGGAEVHKQDTLSREKLAELIGRLMQEPKKLASMAAASRTAGKPDAARLLGDLTEAIASRTPLADYKKGVHP
ncbi:undecaprenyldiphospho-muramoylpentapeptide beta-N-acetylglucosaminyltransferase [Mesorhizobium sp. SB112]|uniref:undecaprenyldiphospho-muramoylpentapeptide beta-N-acetylglucosaminyltransferase n=1 Tax=Mesorhizobium sp. SB112 TaxID=3151853 RepID=UPI00326759E2